MPSNAAHACGSPLIDWSAASIVPSTLACSGAMTLTACKPRLSNASRKDFTATAKSSGAIRSRIVRLILQAGDADQDAGFALDLRDKLGDNGGIGGQVLARNREVLRPTVALDFEIRRRVIGREQQFHDAVFAGVGEQNPKRCNARGTLRSSAFFRRAHIR